MSVLSHEQWKMLSPHLDAVLDMTEKERTAWLSSLRQQDAVLAGALEALLQEHQELSDRKFLEEQTPPPLGQTLAGQTVGVYTVLSEIGHGGMGSVWLAQRSDGRFRRQVAIKFLNIGFLGRSGEQRLKREGSILARLTHANIAELLDAGVTTWGQPYLILEHVEAQHIDLYCDKTSLDVAARIRLFLEVLAAVSHAHRNLIVHCDIKPSNVLVREDSQVKLLDFGIAKLLAGESGTPQTTQLTVDEVRPMTPSFAAPEQLQGEAVTTSTDVYALGVLLYVLLTGHHSVGDGAHSPAELIRAIFEREPIRPSDVVQQSSDANAAITKAAQRSTTPEKLRQALRGDLDTIILKALKKDPSERYTSVTAFAEDLQRYLQNEPISARQDAIAYRAVKFVRRHRLPAVLAILVIVAALVGAGSTLLQARSARMQREFALRQLARVERINSLNELLLTDVAPLGKPLNASDLLDREEQVVEHEKYDDVASHVDLLISIGGQYSGMEENERARRVLEQAYELSRGIHDRSTHARAACELGWALLPSGELDRAESLVNEGLRDIPDQPQFASDKVHCLLRGSDVAYRAGNARLFFDRASSADRVLQQMPVRSPVQELEVLTGLASAYESSGQFREADAAFARAAARMTDLGYGETQKAVKLFNDWGLASSNAGRPLDAEKAYRRSIEISRTNNTEDAVPSTLLHNYSLVLRELGRLKEAADYEERAHGKAVLTGNQMLAIQTNLNLARIYRDQHRFKQAGALLAEIEPLMRQKLPPTHYAFASLTSDKALLAQEQGNLADALRLANEAVAIDEAVMKAGREGSIYLPILLTRGSIVELASGNAERAVADAQRAASLLKDSMQAGTQSSHMGRAYLALGRALEAQGRSDEARSAFLFATEQLRSALGADHPDSRAAQQLAGLRI